MGNYINRWFVAAGISTGMFLAGSTALHAQGMMRPMPSQNRPAMTPSNMGFQSPGMGFGRNMQFSPFQGFGGMMNGRNYSSGANSYGGMGYGGGGYGGSGNGGMGYGGGGYGGSGSGGMSNGGGGYGGSGNGSYGYDTGSYNSMQSSQYYSQSSGYVASSALFKAMGLPVEQGQLAWPIGLQALRPDAEVKSLRDQIDGLIQVAASDRMNGRADGRLVDQSKKVVERLRFLLQTNGKERFYASTYRDSARFLDQLESGLKVLQ